MLHVEIEHSTLSDINKKNKENIVNMSLLSEILYPKKNVTIVEIMSEIGKWRASEVHERLSALGSFIRALRIDVLVDWYHEETNDRQKRDFLAI